MVGAGAKVPSPVATLRVAPERAAAPACPNCGSSLVAEFCAGCGEQQPSRLDYSLRGMLLDAFQEFTALDGRLLRSVRALLTRPGMLTREWFAGRRGRYVKPFSLFVILNLVFFVVQPHTGLLKYDYADYVGGDGDVITHRQMLVGEKRVGTGEPDAAFRARFDDRLQDHKKSLLVVCIPIFACVLALTYAGQKRFFTEHLVFSLHEYTFFLIFATLVTPLYQVTFALLRPLGLSRATLDMLGGQNALIVVIFAVMGSYTVLALRRVYDDRWVSAIPRAILLVLAQQYLIFAYHDALFYTTLYSL